MFWLWKNCRLCHKKLSKDNPQLKLDTSEGPVTLDICVKCADNLEKMREDALKK